MILYKVVKALNFDGLEGAKFGHICTKYAIFEDSMKLYGWLKKPKKAWMCLLRIRCMISVKWRMNVV